MTLDCQQQAALNRRLWALLHPGEPFERKVFIESDIDRWEPRPSMDYTDWSALPGLLDAGESRGLVWVSFKGAIMYDDPPELQRGPIRFKWMLLDEEWWGSGDTLIEACALATERALGAAQGGGA